MIRDLLAADGPVQRDADVVIVGAGIAGLVAAQRLRKAGRKVLLLESGAERQAGEEHELNAVEFDGDPYLGATAGRFRCLGGTSTRWGGAMLPFQPIDMAEDPPGWGIDWPLRLEALAPYQSEVEQLFGLPAGPFDDPGFSGGAGSSDFLARRAKWPTFARRNVAALLARQLRDDDGLETWLNATMTGCTLGPDGRVETIAASAPDGRTLAARAPHILLAAGAIESTRLLMLVDRAHDDRLFAPDGILGCYFHDHLSAHSADFSARRLAALDRMTGFRFERGGMRNLRFEPSADLRRREHLPGGLVTAVFSSSQPSGFDALRDIYRASQRRTLPAGKDLALLARNAPWLARAAWTRFVGRRVLAPPHADFMLNVVIEQHPHRDNRISLSETRHDRDGLPLARIAWRVRDDDVANHAKLFARFSAYWQQAGLARIAAIEPRPPELVRTQLVEGGGIFHPGGTARMGGDPGASVVDARLRVHKIPNLTVISTATFPTGGGANPTYMLMLFALRAADQIALEAAAPAISGVRTTAGTAR
jgi:choline dehydrogenase-like flavoprotein